MVLIFANGDIEKYEWIRPYLLKAEAVLAANGGTRHLLALDRRPDIVLGDMDSLPQPVLSWLETAVYQTIPHPSAKDETDLELALLYAVKNYSGALLVFGAFGGRIDQTLANLLLLAHVGLDGRRVELLSPHQRTWLLSRTDHPLPINGEIGDAVSLIPIGGDVHIRRTTGLRWPLEDEMLSFGPARGISNVMIAAEATVTLGDGRLLCIHTQKAWQR